MTMSQCVTWDSHGSPVVRYNGKPHLCIHLTPSEANTSVVENTATNPHLPVAAVPPDCISACWPYLSHTHTHIMDYTLAGLGDRFKQVVHHAIHTYAGC